MEIEGHMASRAFFWFASIIFLKLHLEWDKHGHWQIWIPYDCVRISYVERRVVSPQLY